MSLLNYLFGHYKLGIKRADLVVEIGAGGDPFLRSDIVIEKFIEDNTERSMGLIVDRTVIAADGAMLPFRDKSIDYIICSHVLEHIADPKPFLDELSHVSKRGLIITPQGGYERLHPKGGHLWYVWNENGILCFKQKKSWNEYPEVREYFRKIASLPGYWKFWGKHYSFFNTMFEWENKIIYRIEKEEEFDFSNFKKASIDSKQYRDSGKSISFKQHIKSGLGKFVRPMISSHYNIDINKIICCPLCRGKLTRIMRGNISTMCESCGAKFPVEQSIPHLLKEEASILT